MNKIKRESSDYKRNTIMALASIFCVLTVVISAEAWRNRQKSVACLPSKKEYNYPLIPYMPDPQGSDGAKLYSFIEKYIYLTRSQSLDQYKKISASSKVKTDYYKKKLEEAIYMSDGDERTRNMENHANSSLSYAKILNCDCSYYFNIDAIERLERVPGSKTIYVSVLGEYQVSFNKNSTKLADPKLGGYKRIQLFLIQDVPETKRDGSYFNKLGLYVVSSREDDVAQSVQESLFAANMILGWGDFNRKHMTEAFEKADKRDLEWGIE